ncbi:MFS transporter [Nitratireductor sp. ZSWI3]|uniref:MFS transporter n=1 Tax=Nitratireductor sp. ZSWI3 TaxID=2966359 RepID=UPI00215027E6|nr:MFS transporter [Nitratireductor sp. ZSWI3]MCR4268809.1 MFS transporter [Nitratireductor sp. ZSWI3]
METPVDGAYAWFRMTVSLLLGTIGTVGLWAIVVVLPPIQAEFGVDRAAASLPYAATMVGFAVGNVLIGRYADRIGVALPVAMAGVALGGGFIAASFSASIWQFALLQGLIGLGGSACFGPLLADISHWFERQRGIAVAAVACGNYLSGVLWPTVIKLALAQTDWRTTFLGIGLFCVATIVPLALLLRRRPHIQADETPLPGGRADSRRKPIDLSPRTLQTLLVLAGLCCCVAMSMPQVHIVAYCMDLGFDIARGAEMLSLMLGAGIVSRLVSGFLADRIGGVPTLLIGSVLQCLSLFLYIPFNGLASLYMVSFIFGLSQGGIVPSYAIIVREYLPAREAGQRMGVVIMATIIGMAFGGWMSGWIYDLTGSYRAAFLNGIAWNLGNMAIAAFILFRARRTARPAFA